jgi:Ca2+:H+ antiporter
VLLVFAPIGYITYLADAHAPIVFTSNALAVIPLSNLLTLATECIARDMGDSVGALLNISFGNLIEMIIL